MSRAPCGGLSSGQSPSCVRLSPRTDGERMLPDVAQTLQEGMTARGKTDPGSHTQKCHFPCHTTSTSMCTSYVCHMLAGKRKCLPAAGTTQCQAVDHPNFCGEGPLVWTPDSGAHCSSSDLRQNLRTTSGAIPTGMGPSSAASGIHQTRPEWSQRAGAAVDGGRDVGRRSPEAAKVSANCEGRGC